MAKNCPHLVWKVYQSGGHQLAGYRRHFCAIENKQPGNMYSCPLDDATQQVRRI